MQLVVKWYRAVCAGTSSRQTRPALSSATSLTLNLSIVWYGVLELEAQSFVPVGRLCCVCQSHFGLHELSISNASGRAAVVCFHMLNAPRSLAQLHNQ